MKRIYLSKKDFQNMHNQLCAELGIKPSKITVQERPSKWMIKNCPDARYLTGVISFSSGKIWIFWSPTFTNWGGNRHPLEVLAHETYHLFQLRSGRISYLPQYKACLYHGKNGSFLITEERPWSKRPWERAAERYAKKIKKRFKL